VSYVLTVDRQVGRPGPDRVAGALRRLADGVPTVLPFERTAGDEFQGVLADPAVVVDVVLRLVREGGWSLGIGAGPVQTPLPDSTRAGADADAPAALAHQPEDDVDDDRRVTEDALELVAPRALEGEHGRDAVREPPQDARDPVGPTAGLPADGQHVRHPASLAAPVPPGKPQSLSTTSGGKPPVAIGPQRSMLTRSSDLPCRVIAARYSSQSGCSPLHLHPRAVEVVGEHAHRHGGVAPGVGRLGPLRVGGHHHPPLLVQAAGHRGQLYAPAAAPGDQHGLVPGTEELLEGGTVDAVGGRGSRHGPDVTTATS
jgi:hypothetical protein